MKEKTQLTTKKVIESNIHHTYKLNTTIEEQKVKNYFSRLKGYRNRK